MPQVSPEEFKQLPLRVHELLADVPLHDVWVVELPWTRTGITLDGFLRGAKTCPFALRPPARVLLKFRFFVGRLLRLDQEPKATSTETFAARLTDADRSKSLVPAGTRDGLFRVVYRFENEQLMEIMNRTAHAAALSALVEMDHCYRFYFAVYVRRLSMLTPVYMTLIDPFRKLIVYPSMLRSVRAAWDTTFAAG